MPNTMIVSRPSDIICRTVRDRRGVAVLEFALIAPILLLMIGGLFSLSSYLHAKTTIHTYAREAARGVAVGYMTVAEAKRFAETRAGGTLRVPVTATIDPPTPGNPADQDVQVTLNVTAADMGKLTPFLNILSGGISSQVVMRGIAQ